MKNILLYMLWMGAALGQLNAQDYRGSISGKITDEQAFPLTGISVGLKGTTFGSPTNNEGIFSIQNVPPGNYTLIVSGIGFETQYTEVNVTDGTVVKTDFTLRESRAELQSVEIFGRREQGYKNDKVFSVTKIEMPVVEVPQSVSFVTKELIQDQQALRLKEVVQNVAGVNEFSVYDDITIRGFRTADGNSRLINGLRTYGNFWTSPLLVNIERVEFIKGPASATFANTNPGGTINMITKKPLRESRQGLSFTTGSFNTFRAQADFTGPLNEDKTLLYRANVGYEDAQTFRDQITNKSVVVAPSVSFLPGEGTRFNADLVYSYLDTKLDRGRTIIQGTEDVFATPINFNIAQPGDYLRQQNLALTLSFSQDLSEHVIFNASYLKYSFTEELNEHGFNGYITPDSIEMYFTDRSSQANGNNLTTYFSGLLYTGPIEHKWIAGYDFIDANSISYDRFAEGEAQGVANMSLLNPTYFKRPVQNYFFNPDYLSSYGAEYITQGIYLQDLMRIDKFQFLLSIRQEFYLYPATDQFQGLYGDNQERAEQNALLPRLGLTYQLNDNINLYATYATGFEPQWGGSLAAAFGGPFDPMTSKLLEAGAKGEFFQKRLLATVSIYEIEQNNILVNANDPGNPDLLEQRGQERARGFEWEATGKINHNLTINLNYAYNNAVITEATEGDINNEVGLVKENAPRHMSGSWIKYSIGSGLFSGLGIAFGHSQVSERETFDRNLQLPGYVIFNSAVYYELDQFRLGLNINNLTDEAYLIGGYNFQRNFPGPPRNVLLNVGYTF